MNYIKQILRNYCISNIRTLAQALSRIDGTEWTIHAKHIQEETELKKGER